MQVYILYHCNKWKEYSSRHTIGVCEQDKLQESLDRIQQETGYSDEEMKTYIDYDLVTVNELENI